LDSDFFKFKSILTVCSLKQTHVLSFLMVCLILGSIVTVKEVKADGPNRLVLLGIEATQSIQNMNNDMPLLHAKPTVARAYLYFHWTQGEVGSVQHVRGTISGFDESGHLLGQTSSLNEITVGNSYDLTSMRQNLGASLNFRLPAWLPYNGPAGSVHLTFTPVIDPVTAGIDNAASLSCFNCVNRNTVPDIFRVISTGNFESAQLTTPRYIHYEPSTRIAIDLRSMPYVQNSVVHRIGTFERDMVVSWLKRAFPLSYVAYTTSSTRIENSMHDCAEFIRGENAGSWIARFFLPTLGLFRPDPVLGLLSVGTVDYHGCALPGLGIWPINYSPPIGSGAAPTPGGEGNDADRAGHELAHEFGRLHPDFVLNHGNCVRGVQEPGNPHVDRHYPYINGYLDNSIAFYQRNPSTAQEYSIVGQDNRWYGFDVGDNSIQHYNANEGIMRVHPPDTSTDLMTYCTTAYWLSDYTYRNVLYAINTQSYYFFDWATPIIFGNNQSVGDHFGTPSTNPMGEKNSNMTEVSNAVLSTNKTLFISGEIFLPKFDVQLDPFLVLPGLKPAAQTAQKSSYTVNLLSQNGTNLASYPLFPNNSTQGSIFFDSVPYTEDTKEITIKYNDKVLASRLVSNTMPEAQMIPPKPTDIVDDILTLKWKSVDAENDNLTNFVLYSRDNGQSWITLAGPISQQSLKLNTTDLPGGQHVIFRLVVTDGVNTKVTDTNSSIRVPVKPPHVSIMEPFENFNLWTTRSSNNSLPLSGYAEDIQDSFLEDKGLTWTDNIQGFIGTGPSVNMKDLVPGKHTITLTATNKEGMKASENVHFTISDCKTCTYITK